MQFVSEYFYTSGRQAVLWLERVMIMSDSDKRWSDIDVSNALYRDSSLKREDRATLTLIGSLYLSSLIDQNFAPFE